MQTPSKIDKALRIIKNSIAMLASATIAKGGGLIVAVLVARYLGAAAFGLFAVIQSMSLLLEMLLPLGQQDVIVRTVARERTAIFSHWLNASLSTLLVSLVLGAGVAIVALFKGFGADTNLALYVAAAGFPFAGLNLISQAVLQGAERMEYQAIAAFVGRVVGLLLLWMLLANGAGIWAAFAGRAVFQGISWVILSRAIWSHTRRNNWPIGFRMDITSCKKDLGIAFPFLLQKFLTEGFNRLNVMILPILFTLATVGLFNAAMQITQASSMIIQIVMLVFLPLFTRSFQQDTNKLGSLSDQMVKFMLIFIFPAIFFIAVLADKIILLLYGSGYEGAVALLQVVVWAQVFFAVDAVMKQNMIASDNEGSMVLRSALALTVNIVLTIVFGKIFGVIGVVAAVVVSSAFLLALDVIFVTRHVAKSNLIQVMGKPFICAAIAGLAALSVQGQGLIAVIVLAGIAYAACLYLFRAFSGEELSLLRQLCRRFLVRSNG
jgi:O-antigen/teichoic acid export membrane protein